MAGDGDGDSGRPAGAGATGRGAAVFLAIQGFDIVGETVLARRLS